MSDFDRWSVTTEWATEWDRSGYFHTSQTPPSVHLCPLTLGPLEVERHMFASEAACHAAIRQGGPNLKWDGTKIYFITDQDAQYIASALVNPVVRSVVPFTVMT